MKRILLLTLTFSLILAGCATPEDGTDGNNTGTDNGNPTGSTQQLSNADALRLLNAAGQEFPDMFGFEMRALDADGKEMLLLKGAVNNATKTSYMEISGDPDALGEDAGESGQFLKSGFSIYMTPQGGAYIVNGTAITFPAGDESSHDGMMPSPGDNPFKELANPEDLFSAFEDSNVTVTSVKPITYRSKAAVEIMFTATEDNETMNGKMIFFQNPTRVAHFEADGPLGMMSEDGSDQSDEAFAKIAKFSGEFYYEDSQLEVPTNAKRALGLAYKSDANPFAYGNDESENQTTTWTFLNSAGISLGEVELQAKEGSGTAMNAPNDFNAAATPTLWSMKLSDKTATHGSTTVTFNDVDGDGKVSAGDTLSMTTTGDEEAPLMLLHDDVTGLYVVPGIAPFVGVLAILGLALILRRR